MNYFQYFSEIEELFSRRRGSVLLLSTLDWALIETWREAGIPLAAVLRGVDNAFDKHDAQRENARGRARKINGLAWCAQAVLRAAEEMVEASTGVAPQRPAFSVAETGFESERIAGYIERNARLLDASATSKDALAVETIASTANRLRALSVELRSTAPPLPDALDRTLTVLEERLLDALRTAASEGELLEIREATDRELGPYRAKMGALQLRQIAAQMQTKRLLERVHIPRLSLFYMDMNE